MVYGSKKKRSNAYSSSDNIVITCKYYSINVVFWFKFFKYRANTLKLPKFSWFYSYEKVLTKDNIWESLQTTAIIVAGSVGMQMVL